MGAGHRLTLLVALSCISCGANGARVTGGGDTHGLVGVRAPSFSKPSLSGGAALSTEGAKGKVLIIDFWATYCTPCAKEFPKLQALVDRRGGSLVVYALSEDDTTDGVLAFAKKAGVKFPIAWDEGNAISRRYNLDKMPTSFIVDRKGIVRFVHGGYVDGEEDQIAREVDELLR
jgi:cytochrome c biogenesis protein CcmG, thiol:disulfide interchange protein DsbE